MADNVTFPLTGSGDSTAVAATDEVGGVHYQRVKLDIGADGAASAVNSSNPLPISDAGGNISIDDGGNTITVDGTVAVTHAALTELAAAIDTEMQVDVVGALPAGTNNIGDVDILSIAAGNNNIGDVDVASIAAGDNNIGNVDIVSLPASTNTIEIVGDAAHDAAVAGNPVLVGGYASAAAPSDVSGDGDVARIWTTVKGAVNVADAGGSLTVDVGTALPAGTNNIGDVDVLSSALPTGASTLAEQQTQTTHLATIAGDTTDIEAAVELIDDTIFADDAAYTAATSKLMVVGGQYQSTPNALDDNDAGSILLDANHAVQAVLRAGTAAFGKLAANSGVDIGDVDITSIAAGDNNIGNVDIASIAAGDNNIGNVDIVSLPALAAGTAEIGSLLPPDTDVTAHTNYAKKYYTSAGAATDGIVWSPAAGKRYHVVSMFINTSAAATVTFEDDKAGGDEAIMKMELAANSGFTINFGEQYPLASGEDAADLLVTTTAGNIYITCTGYEI